MAHPNDADHGKAQFHLSPPKPQPLDMRNAYADYRQANTARFIAANLTPGTNVASCRMATASQTASALEWVAALGTPMSIIVGVLIASGAFWRRPNLSMHERPDEWGVERNSENVPIPSLRLVVRNGRLHRAAKGTRVLVEGYRRGGQRERVSLASVPLGWTSAADEVDAGVVIFPDGERSVDLGIFRSYLSGDGGTSDEWALAIAPAFAPYEGRNVLRADHEGYFIRLIVGSDDGRARRYDVYINWNPEKRLVDNEWNSSALLDSVLMKVSKVR
jgi:hypothetical protein